MPDNILKVDLQVDNSAKATADVTTFKNTIVQTGEAAETAGKKIVYSEEKLAASYAKLANLPPIIVDSSQFSNTIANVEKQALNLQFTLRKIQEVSIGTPGIDGLGKAAQRAETALQATYARLLAIEAEAGRTKDPVILERLRTEAAAASAEMTTLLEKINRVAAGRSAAAAGGGAGGNKLNSALNLAGAAGIPFANEAQQAVQLSKDLGINMQSAEAAAAEMGTTLASVGATLGVGLLAITAAKLIFDGIARNAEVRLKQEEKISIEYGKQQTMLSDIRKEQFEFAQQRQKDADAAQLVKTLAGPTVQTKVIGTDDRAALVDKRKALEESLALDQKYWKLHLETSSSVTQAEQDAKQKAFKEQEDTIRQFDSALRTYDDKRAAAEQASFDQRFEDSKKNEADKKAFEEKVLQERLQSVNAARAKINELATSADELFAGLFAAQGSDNPFVKVFSDAEAAIDRTTEATKNLSKELQKQAADMTAAANANNLFKARIDNAVNAANLLSAADKFRGADSRAFTDDQAKEKFQRSQRDFIANNPNFVFLKQQEFQNRQADQNDPLSFNGQTFQEFLKKELDKTTFNFKNQPESISDKLDKQIKAMNQFVPTSDEQKAAADRKIIALTESLKPEDLTEAQRAAAAKARENEAERLTTAETTAKAAKEDENNVQKSIDVNIKKLLKIAQTDGLTGVIRIINEAEDRARESLGKRPRIDDQKTADMMEP